MMSNKQKVSTVFMAALLLAACGGMEEDFDIESQQEAMMADNPWPTCPFGGFIDASNTETCYDLSSGSGTPQMPAAARVYGKCNNWHINSRCWGADCLYLDHWYMSETCNGQSLYEKGSCVRLSTSGTTTKHRCTVRSGSNLVFKRR